MVRIIFVFLFSVSLLSAFTQKDLKLRDGGIITFGGIDAKIVSFGGDATPECRLAISLDGRYFYLTKMHSSCRKFVNKKSQKIICNANKSICKTRDELRAFVSGAHSGSSDSRTGIVSGLRAAGDGFLSVRTKPKGRKIGELYNGDKVAILGQRGFWYKIRTASGLVGWSHGDWIESKISRSYGEHVYSQGNRGSIPPWCNAGRLNKTEHMICADETLGKLDAELVKAYAAAKADTLDSEQRAWLGKRNQCRTDVACIRQAYETRIAQLRQENTSENLGLARWQKQGDVVIDTKLGLMWQDNTAAKRIEKTWQDAKSYCKNLTLAGYGDWYLPSYDELLTIVDYGRYDPAIMPSFKNVASSFYWSSSQTVSATKYAWIVFFKSGGANGNSKSDEFYVRCVRHRQ